MNNEGTVKLVDVVRIAPFLEIQRTRTLPLPGRVIVQQGDPVTPNDVIAEASVPGEVVMLDIARGLGIPTEEVLSCLARELGEQLSEGDILAQTEGTLPRLVRSTVNGRFVACHQGKAFLARGETTFQLKAGMIGQVEALIPEYGAVLSTKGSLVQGVWGNGKIGSGSIKIIETSMESSLTASELDDQLEGCIVAAGLCLDGVVLQQSEALGLSGLIFGAMAPGLIPAASQLEIPVIVLQGFGQLTPDLQIFDLLKSHPEAEAYINAAEVDPLEGQRPEIVIPLDEGEPGEDLGFKAEIRIGLQVREIAGERMGQSGEVVGLPEDKTTFENGLAFKAAEVRLQNGETVKIPLQNLVIVN